MPTAPRNRHERHKFQAIAVRPKDAAEMSGISESKIYELMLAGQLSALKCGSATLITIASIEAYLASLPLYVSRHEEAATGGRAGRRIKRNRPTRSTRRAVRLGKELTIQPDWL
jgi:hypothetical protein